MLLPAALICLVIAGFLNRPLLARRQTFLPANQTDLRSAPPLVAFTTVALGGFRGILADMLWMRITTLQDEGRFFEINQLADWITRLEPTFSEVWSYHAWNMAYNIGILFENEGDRWRWVENGIRMLRDGGIRNNPGDPRLYWELGWLYFSKVGGYLDEASPFYRVRLYESMDGVLPGGRLTKAESQNPGLKSFFHLDPAVMAEVDRSIGPLDWRLPESQALYWAWRGRQLAPGKGDIFLERLYYQAMVAACFRGRAVYSAQHQSLLRLPRVDLFESGLRVLDEVLSHFPDDEGIASARRNFLRNAVVQAYAHADDDKARRLLEAYRVREPSSPSQLRPFMDSSVAKGGVVTEGVLDQVAGYVLEAEWARLRGHDALAARLQEGADRTHESLKQLLGPEEQDRVPTLARIREQISGFIPIPEVSE